LLRYQEKCQIQWQLQHCWLLGTLRLLQEKDRWQSRREKKQKKGQDREGKGKRKGREGRLGGWMVGRKMEGREGKGRMKGG